MSKSPPAKKQTSKSKKTIHNIFAYTNCYFYEPKNIPLKGILILKKDQRE